MKKSKVHTFSATDETVDMLESVAEYHQLSKSATIASLIKKEFWRLFPAGTRRIKPLKGVRIDNFHADVA